MRTEQLLNDLATSWNNLTVLERAEGVRACRRRKLSGRKIAKAVGCSEAYLRYIQPALELPDDQREQIRRGAEVRPFLLEYARQQKLLAVAKATDEAKRKSKGIEKWMNAQDIPETYRKQVVAQAFLYLLSLAQSPKDFELCRSHFPKPVLNGEDRPEGPLVSDQLNHWAKVLAQYLLHDATWEQVIRQLEKKYPPR